MNDKSAVKRPAAQNSVSVWSEYSNWSQSVTVDEQPKLPLLYDSAGRPLRVGLERIGFKSARSR